MQIQNLSTNNIQHLEVKVNHEHSLGVAGLSGSGKTTFCRVIADESKKRLVTLLPKSEYQFLFSDLLDTNCTAQSIEDMPMILFLGKSSISSNPRSTIGTHSGVFKEIRGAFAQKYALSPENFSFNNAMGWCTECKGRGNNRGNICAKCEGTRYNKDLLKYTIDIQGKSYNIAEISEFNTYKLIENSEMLQFSEPKLNFLRNMQEMNIGYLTINRIMSTLSGGELTRLYLSEFMSAAENAVIVIDEISVGLDHETLLKILEQIQKIGKKNQVLLIDHSDTVLDTTQEKLFFGPGSGKYGGKIVQDSPRPAPILQQRNIQPVLENYTFTDLFCRNVMIDSISLPKNRLISFTGESGCGKSTLINDCIVKVFSKIYPKDKLVIVGQDRNQSITSRSTIATFLDVKRKLSKYGDEIFQKSIEDIICELDSDDVATKRLDMLVKLGLGYLSLNRKTQTLSTGEFQCIHLVSELSFASGNLNTLFVFDEPSKGLSQNILNQFIESMRHILQDKTVSIFMIEHNLYMLESSDFIVDFGKRKSEIRQLDVAPYLQWSKGKIYDGKDDIICSKLTQKSGINFTKSDNLSVFKTAETIYKGGVLKNMSSLARVVYSGYECDIIAPVIAIDLERQLYSQNTFVYEIAGLINHIVALQNTNDDSFDFYSRDNHCPCCYGRRVFENIDIYTLIRDENASFWQGMLHEEVMKVLEYFQYKKIQFFFDEILREYGLDMSKSYASMTEQERFIFLYGDWKKSFYDKQGKSTRIWEGFVYILSRYMTISKSQIKEDMQATREKILCPICKGTVLNHDKKLMFDNLDIREIIQKTISENQKLCGQIPAYNKLSEILEENVCLTDDVSLLPVNTQVKLKLLEIEMSYFTGFTIYIQNTLPFWSEIEKNINKISEKNEVVICDFDGVTQTFAELVEQFVKKFKKVTYVYEAFGFSKIITAINKIKAANQCSFCGGKRMISEDGLYEGVDKLAVPCELCSVTGISNDGLDETVNDITVRTWLLGSVSDVVPDAAKQLENIPISARIRELNKRDLMNLFEWMLKK